jgi:dolichol-phosphate mannosyltransferase
MSAEVARSLDLRADLHRYIPLLAASKGFRVAEVPVSNRPRQHGESKYGGGKYFTSTVALIGVVLYLRYGHRPMALFGGLGLVCFLAGLAIDLYYAGVYLFAGRSIDPDFPTVVLGLALILMGTQFLSLGLLGDIVVRRLRAVEDVAGATVVEEL